MLRKVNKKPILDRDEKKVFVRLVKQEKRLQIINKRLTLLLFFAYPLLIL